MRRPAGFTLVELLACLFALGLVFAFVAPAVWRAYESSALAVSAENIRQLTAGGMQYLAENDHRFWKYRESGGSILDEKGNLIKGATYWFGFESDGSAKSGEGNRSFDAAQGPLAGYVPRGIRPDPSFALHGSAFKPKFKSGYLGIGYNVLLGGGWSASKKTKTKTFWELENPARVAVFATCGQVNTFQSPASASRPMLEEFYGFDQRETTIHFLRDAMAMVGFADGSGGFLPMDKSTADNRIESVNIGRFAPVGSFQYLQ